MVGCNVSSQIINQFFSGFAVNSHIVIARKSDDGNTVLHQLSVVGNGTNSIKTKRQLTREDEEKLVNDVLEILRDWRTREKVRRQLSRCYVKKPRGNTIHLNLRYIGLPCMVGKRYEGNAITGLSQWSRDEIDACDKSASVSLFFTIDFIRSVADPNLGTEDAKYFRITLNPESSGGAGWHIIEKPNHRHSWFFSWTDRETWFGPVADSYSIGIYPHDDIPRLYHSIPGNLPVHSHVSARTKIKIGFYGDVSGMGGNEYISDRNDTDIVERDEYSFNSLNMQSNECLPEIKSSDYVEDGEYSFNSLNVYDEYNVAKDNQVIDSPEMSSMLVDGDMFSKYADLEGLRDDAYQAFGAGCDFFEAYYRRCV